MGGERGAADLRPGERVADVAVLADDRALEGAVAGRIGVGLHDHTTAGAQHLAAASQQRGGVAADADVAVEQQGGAPRALVGDRVEDRAVMHREAGAAHDLDGDGGDIHPERFHAAGDGGFHHASRAAPHIEHRAAGAA